MKQSKITIKDAKRKGGKGYKLASIAKNGEPLEDPRGQVFNSPNAVKVHILAMMKLYKSVVPIDSLNIIDLTKDQTFVKKGWAKSGLTPKSK